MTDGNITGKKQRGFTGRMHGNLSSSLPPCFPPALSIPLSPASILLCDIAWLAVRARARVLACVQDGCHGRRRCAGEENRFCIQFYIFTYSYRFYISTHLGIDAWTYHAKIYKGYAAIARIGAFTQPAPHLRPSRLSLKPPLPPLGSAHYLHPFSAPPIIFTPFSAPPIIFTPSRLRP